MVKVAAAIELPLNLIHEVLETITTHCKRNFVNVRHGRCHSQIMANKKGDALGDNFLAFFQALQSNPKTIIQLVGTLPVEVSIQRCLKDRRFGGTLA